MVGGGYGGWLGGVGWGITLTTSYTLPKQIANNKTKATTKQKQNKSYYKIKGFHRLPPSHHILLCLDLCQELYDILVKVSGIKVGDSDEEKAAKVIEAELYVDQPSLPPLEAEDAATLPPKGKGKKRVGKLTAKRRKLQ